MVLFFGIAAKEVTESCLPGGSLNPPRKALAPLIATVGGVAGPVAVYAITTALAECAGEPDGRAQPSRAIRTRQVLRGQLSSKERERPQAERHVVGCCSGAWVEWRGSAFSGRGGAFRRRDLGEW